MILCTIPLVRDCEIVILQTLHSRRKVTTTPSLGLTTVGKKKEKVLPRFELGFLDDC